MTGDALVGPGRDWDQDPFKQLVQQVHDLRRYVDDKTSMILRTAGLRAEPDLLRVLGSLVVEGSLNVTGTETVSGDLNVTGTETVSGDLNVPSGVINLAGVDQDLAQAINDITDLLSNQVNIVTATKAQQSTAVTQYPTFTNYSPLTITVPAGYTKASALAVSNFDTQGLSTGGVDVRTVIGPSVPSSLSGDGKMSRSHAATLTGLSGGNTFVIASQAATTLPATVASIWTTTTTIVIFTR